MKRIHRHIVLFVSVLLIGTSFSLTGCGSNKVALSAFEHRAPPNDKLVVFISGVLGDAQGTWENADTKAYWPNLVANDPELKAFDVYVVSYRTTLLDYSSNISEVANSILQDLIDKGFFRDYKQIHLITHSMGGLIAKRMLVSLNRSFPENYLLTMRSVLLISTPSLGAELGKLASLFSRNPQFQNMAPADLNAYIQTLEDDWQALLRQRRDLGAEWPVVYCAYETLPTYGAFVATRVYTSTQCDGNRLAVDADHLAIVKPGSRDEPPYPWARARVLEASKMKGPINRKVLLMDSALCGMVYDAAGARVGRTNADEIATLLQELPVVSIKELTHADWRREDQIKKLRPDLIIIHLSAFYPVTTLDDSDHRFRSFLRSLRNSGIQVIAYTRGLPTKNRPSKDGQYCQLKGAISNFIDESSTKNLAPESEVQKNVGDIVDQYERDRQRSDQEWQKKNFNAPYEDEDVTCDRTDPKLDDIEFRFCQHKKFLKEQDVPLLILRGPRSTFANAEHARMLLDACVRPMLNLWEGKGFSSNKECFEASQTTPLQSRSSYVPSIGTRLQSPMLVAPH